MFKSIADKSHAFFYPLEGRGHRGQMLHQAAADEISHDR
jgi:hypothetical protein